MKENITLPRKRSLFHIIVHQIVSEIICVLREEDNILIFGVLIKKGQEELSIITRKHCPYNIAFCCIEIKENTFF